MGERGGREKVRREEMCGKERGGKLEAARGNMGRHDEEWVL